MMDGWEDGLIKTHTIETIMNLVLLFFTYSLFLTEKNKVKTC